MPLTRSRYRFFNSVTNGRIIYNLLIGGIVVLISIVVPRFFDYDRDVHKNIVQPNDQVTEAQLNEQNPS